MGGGEGEGEWWCPLSPGRDRHANHPNPSSADHCLVWPNLAREEGGGQGGKGGWSSELVKGVELCSYHGREADEGSGMWRLIPLNLIPLAPLHGWGVNPSLSLSHSRAITPPFAPNPLCP